MGKLKALVDKYSKIDIEKEFYKAFKDAEIQRLIIKLNRQNQLFAEGVGVDGEVVGYYSLFTERVSEGRKKFNTPYNFLDSGELFKSFVVLVDNNGFSIEADTDKLEDSNIIESENQILGLTDESKIQLIREVIPKIVRQIKGL